MANDPTHRVPRQSSALAREGLRDPRVLVGPVPDGDANAAGQRLARGDDGLVVRLLLLEQRRSGGEGHADVELRDGDLDAERGERGKVLLDVAGQGADDEVALDADAVDGDAPLLEVLDEVQHRG